ncbi:MAG: hypothetical protein N3D16_02080 [Anaerolineales bacterium]|nr:hypothetical protein [Anaerolineales bacterium]
MDWDTETLEEPSVLDYIRSLLRDWRRLPAYLRELRQKETIEAAPSSEAAADAETQARATAAQKTRQSLSSLGEIVPTLPAAPQEGLTVETISVVASAEQAQALPQRLSRTERLAVLSSLSGLILALFAQAALEPPNPDATFGIVFYGTAAAVLLFASLRAGLEVPSRPPPPPPLGEGRKPSPPNPFSRGEGVSPAFAGFWGGVGQRRFGFSDLWRRGFQ